MSRKRIEQLAKDQKFEEAAKAAAALRDDAKRMNDESLWTWTLIKEVQLRMALHGYETSVRFLKEEAWPPSPVQRNMLDLFYAQSLLTYYEAYSWEINSRERVEASGPVDLKAWTKDQIFAEAWAALMRVWKDRERLQDRHPKEFPDFWTVGNYPAGIRDTLRDAVVYLMARVLADTTFWTPRQTNEIFLVSLDQLLSGEPLDAKSAASALDSAAAHPLEKLRALLAEHETWCGHARRPEAAMEARFELLAALHTAFTQADDRSLIRESLAKYLAAHRKLAWWAVGQAMLAEFTQDEEAPDALVRARKLALEAVELYPNSPGGLRALHLVKSIEAPDFETEMMATDRTSRRSIRLNHKNIATVYFRAYPVDLTDRIATSKDYNILPQWNEADKIIQGRSHTAAWKAELPPTPDYREHYTYVDVPASLRPGLYIVAASAREDFARSTNRIRALDFVVSGIVMLKRTTTGGGMEAVIVSGDSGRPTAGVKVDLYSYNWQKGHQLVESQVTDVQGLAAFAARANESGPYFLMASKGADIVFDPAYMYLYSRPKAAETSAALIYTDRSIYRPGQKLYWKLLAYAGRQDLGKLRPAANSTASIWLEDINGQRVAEATSTTNAFGTASGEFLIPAAGRPLGAWRLRASPQGYAQVRVEEYKRPTFEVTVKDPEKPLRLNRPATLKSEARYYFGLPVASGTAVWQVKREAIYPRWWWWEMPGTKAQVVAGGRASLREDGTIEVSFTPKVDERNAGADSGLTYRYTLERRYNR